MRPLRNGTYEDTIEIRRRFKLNDAHVRRLLRFPYLAPDIIEVMGSAKTRHQKVASETRGQIDASVAQILTRRPRRIREMPRYRVVLRAFAGWPVETGLAGWGGRIRNFAFRMIVPNPRDSAERLRRLTRHHDPAFE
jgi:hypothetical protein